MLRYALCRRPCTAKFWVCPIQQAKVMKTWLQSMKESSQTKKTMERMKGDLALAPRHRLFCFSHGNFQRRCTETSTEPFAKMLRPKHGWLTFVLDQAWQHLQLREMDTTTLGGLAQKATESSFSSSFFSTFALT